MTIDIRNSRLGLVAGQCFFEQHWRQTPGPDRSPWVFDYYRTTFNRLRGGNTAPAYAFPWASQTSTFWQACLGGQALAGVGVSAAWNVLVPLRLTDDRRPQVATDNPSERVFYDVYGYPHGIVVSLTVQSARKTAETLDAWCERTRRLRHDRPFTLANPPRKNLSAQDVLDAVLDWHRDTYYGDIDERFGSAEPISLGTVIQGSGVDGTQPADDTVRRALHAVTAWPPDWRRTPLPKFEDHLLPVRATGAMPGDAFYMAPRSRTLWRPALFATANSGKRENRRHTLSCLAHNLQASAAHAESLRLFALGFSASKTAQEKLGTTDLPARAADMLDRTRRGQRTYRSSSAQKIIEDANSKAEVNALLAQYKHPVF